MLPRGYLPTASSKVLGMAMTPPLHAQDVATRGHTWKLGLAKASQGKHCHALGNTDVHHGKLCHGSSDHEVLCLGTGS